MSSSEPMAVLEEGRRRPATVIGVAGGTGSGKTTVSSRIWEAVGAEQSGLYPA